MTTTLETTAPEAPAASQRADQRPASRPWLGLFTVLAAMILNILDSSIVNVAAPSIRAELGGSYASLQWTIAGYTLALALGLLTGGRLGDMFGRKRMLLIGVAGFALASAACAFAWSPESLIGARIVQGLFGAVMIPQAFGLIRDLFPPEKIGKAFGALGPVIGFSTILGPIVAGLLVDADVLGTGWRMIFAINLPLCLFSLIVGAIVLPNRGAAHRGSRLDIGGALLAGLGVCLLVYPLVQGREHDWPLWSLAMLAASVPVLALFVAHQVRRRRAGKTTLIELSVFAKRSYTSGALFVMVFFGSIVGFSLVVGLFLQIGLGYSPVRASLGMMGWAVGAFVGSGVAAATMAKLGRKLLHIGLSLMMVGSVVLYAVFEHYGIGLDAWNLAGPLLVYGIGMGMIFVPLFDIIMGDITDTEVGSASGALESIQQLGASLGVAVLGTVFFGVIGAQAHHNFDTHAAPTLRAELSAAGVPGTAGERIVAGVRTCLHDRENATDPDEVPASCAANGQPTDAAVAKAAQRAGRETHERDSLDATKRTLLVAMGLNVVAFALGFLLPRRARQGAH